MKNWKLLLGVAISAVCLFWFLRMCNFPEMWAAFRRANLWFVLLTQASIFGSYVARAFRWRFLLRPVKQVGLGPSLSATVIGFTASNVLPMRAGEFVRAYVLAKNENVRATSTFATIVVERLCDGFCVLAILVAVLTLIPFPNASGFETLSPPMRRIVGSITPERLKLFGLGSLALYVGIIIVLVFLRFAPRKTEEAIRRVLFFAPGSVVQKITDLLGSFAEGIGSINSLKQALNVLVWSAITWGVIAIGPWLLALAFGLELPIYIGFFVTAILAIGVMLPSSPGFVGIFQLATAASMVLLSVPEQVATSYSIMLWALSIIPVTIIGFILCWVGKTSFIQIVRASRASK